MPASANRLRHESSPYLLQHAHNPVDWFPWGEEALARARQEQKPLLVSIGYAACHWCHVMEHESFENPQVAALMNAHFVCVKVDREERPDVDQIYMDALQAMGLRGGWPLNVFLTPDAKPFYGGTYFRSADWLSLLTSIGTGYAGEHRAELNASAEQFAQVLQISELEKFRVPESAEGLSKAQFAELIENLAARFDRDKGGLDRFPKFPMPVIWRFLLRAQLQNPAPKLLEQLHLTLREMAWGGLYDQIGGGFARYSTDADWLVPHFEKMLYDQGQLLSLYAEAFQATGEALYREVVYGTVDFLQRELRSPEGGFYSSLDADSEGVEGKFYVWTRKELQTVLGDEERLATAYYQCTAVGNWEHGANILHRRQSDADFAAAHELAPAVLTDLVRGWQARLLAARAQRPRPALDDKVLTSWNALTIQGLLDAYQAFGEPGFLRLAQECAEFLRANLLLDGQLYRSCKAGRASVPAFLEDYALLIQAFIGLYEATFADEWLHEAQHLTTTVLAHFFDPAEQQFFYTADNGEVLIARKKELIDNVLPASNSVMAHNLHRLGLHFEDAEYPALAAAMLRRVQVLVAQEPANFANWASLYAALLRPTAEIALVGPEAENFRRELSRNFLPNTVLAGAPQSSALPLLRGREAQNGTTTAYVCFNRACQRPVYSVAEALAQL